MASAAPAAPTASPWPTFAICAIGAYIPTFDFSVVNVAFPEIMRSFHGASRADVSWVVTIYNIFFGSLLVVAGKTADRVGHKRIFQIGASVFALGSLVCFAAPTLLWLVVGRAVQGAGGAFLAPATLGLLLGAFPPERRTEVVSMWGGIGALGVASGPSIGAALISVTNWRAAFVVNVPICIGAVVFGRSVLKASKGQTSAHRPDYFGAGLVTIALGALALGVSQSDDWGWSSPKTIGSLLVAVVLVPTFIRRQARHVEPVLDLTLFRQKSFSVANATTLCFGAAFAALGLNNVLFLRQVWGWSVLHAGLATAPGPIVVALLARRTGRFATRVGFRPVIVGGSLTVVFAGLLLIARMGARPSLALWLSCYLFVGVGVACVISVNSSAAVSTLEPNRFAIGGAVNNTSRQIGSVLGVALLVPVLGKPKGIDALLASHKRGWWLVVIAALISAVVASVQPAKPRTRP